jgi:hypothetical protein
MWVLIMFGSARIARGRRFFALDARRAPAMSQPTTNQWSPRCPKCGKLTDVFVEPAPNHILGGRLSPRAIATWTGKRVRCSRCSTWFPIAPGTEWVNRPTAVKPATPEGRGGEMPEQDEG